MSQRALTYIASLQRVLSESEYAVAQALATLAREEDDQTEATIAQIGESAQRKQRCVLYCLKALERLGYIRRTRQQAGRTRAITRYTFRQLETPEVPTSRLAEVRNFTRAAQRKAAALRERNRRQVERLMVRHDPIYAATLAESLEREACC